MSSYWLLFTIGPVKPIIDHSRKIRDLYAGSYLLSYLMESALDALEQKDGVRVILPVKEGNNIPNRILARVSGFDKTARQALAEYLENTVRQRFRKICAQLFSELGISPSVIALAQLERFPEFYWAYEKVENGINSSASVTEKLQSIKQLRIFSQTSEPPGRKCVLFPEYNAVFAKKNEEGNFPKHIDQSNVTDVTGVKACKYAVKTSESLSAIAFVKRMMSNPSEGSDGLPDRQKGFPSVAYMLLNERLEPFPDYMRTLHELKDNASEAVFDLQNDPTFSLEDYKKYKEQKKYERYEEYGETRLAIAQELYQRLKQDNIKVSPYYALVKFDGDDMGALYRECVDEDEQSRLSQDVGRFAATVNTTIERYKGICIYAGGEDFLGFLPLKTLLPTMLDLHRTFQQRVKAPVMHGKPLTFSSGIVVTHLMQPLQDVLELADELETCAKQTSLEKDAFAMAVVKRGGAGLRIKNRFGRNGMNMNLLNLTVCDLRRMKYSVSFVYRLVEALDRIKTTEDSQKNGMVNAIIQQAFLSTCNERLNRRDTPTTTLENFDRLYHCFGCDIVQFIAALQTADFLEREMAPCTIE